MRTVLILGGTGEARTLAAALVADGSWRVVSSLAGRVSDPVLPAGEVRVGGFGGPDALADWIRAEHVTAVVDATHPFAARISASAAAAADAASVPLILLRRPPWKAGSADRWHRVPTMAAAATALAEVRGRVLLTTGRGGLDVFAHLPHRFIIRTVDPPDPPLPADHVVLLSRGPYTLAGERALMAEHHVRTLVTKDSGGDMTVAKLTAARELGIAVVMVNRPEPPPGVDAVTDPAAVLRWLRSVS
ncbi:MAG TPA: cobalt-precorrin-6A reductase [Sporichthya sp.]|nr:cobalt-precorrin-6A reductase [Sporichthya sp.]